MGTYFKIPKERFEYRMNKKKGLSVEQAICLILKPRKSWENGLSFKKLKEEIERRKNKIYCKVRIYGAISLINRYGKNYDVYLRSGYGHIEDENNQRKIEYRYFIPTESIDVEDEKRNLNHKEQIINEKATHLDYHEKITIPQEQKLREIRAN
jgi:hypothetical protein